MSDSRLCLRYDTLDVFATGRITSLEYVEFFCGFPPKDAFNALVIYNKSIRVVTINVWVVAEIPEDLNEITLLERCCELVSCFMKSPALESLVINDDSDDKFPGIKSFGFFEPVRELIRTRYRHRRVEVSILGTDFY